MRVNDILRPMRPSVEKGNHHAENGRILNDNDIRPVLTQDTPGLPGLHQISYRQLQQFTGLPTIYKMDLCG